MLSEAWQECCHAERVSATFQCVSTAKVHLLTNTRMVARVFARIPVFFIRFFSASRFRRSSEAVKVIKTKRKRSSAHGVVGGEAVSFVIAKH